MSKAFFLSLSQAKLNHNINSYFIASSIQYQWNIGRLKSFFTYNLQPLQPLQPHLYLHCISFHIMIPITFLIHDSFHTILSDCVHSHWNTSFHNFLLQPLYYQSSYSSKHPILTIHHSVSPSSDFTVIAFKPLSLLYPLSFYNCSYYLNNYS